MREHRYGKKNKNKIKNKRKGKKQAQNKRIRRGSIVGI